MTSIVLLGDSIFDNRIYTAGGPDVATQLRGCVPSSWKVTLCAIDGATTHDVGRQFNRVPKHASHIVMSLGGNDALGDADLLGPFAVGSTGEALDVIGERVEAFRRSYGYALDGVLDLGRPTTVCTIYDANLDVAVRSRVVTALALFNDVIIRAALERNVDIIDLRLICTEAADYANEIEPGPHGGQKIALAIARAVGATKNDDDAAPRVFTR